MGGRQAYVAALAAVLVTGCQFASAPPSVAPTPVGRSGSLGGAATPTPAATGTRPASTTAPASPLATTGIPASAQRSAIPVPQRSATPAPSPGRTATVPPPTLGRADGTTPSATARTTGGAMLPDGREQVTGEIADFAASARVMRVRVDGGGERPISLSESAPIRRSDGSPGSAADLRPGQRVQAVGQKGSGDALVADDVRLLAPR